jgi:hypothetical protein
VDRVIIGVDPHKKSVTFEARDSRERATGCFPTDAGGYRLLLKYARQWPDRVWAVEGANGIRDLEQIPGRLKRPGQRHHKTDKSRGPSPPVITAGDASHPDPAVPANPANCRR